MAKRTIESIGDYEDDGRVLAVVSDPASTTQTYGGPQHKAALESAYGMEFSEAERIIKACDDNPQNLAFMGDKYRAAKAMTAALNTKPVPNAKKPFYVPKG